MKKPTKKDIKKWIIDHRGMIGAFVGGGAVWIVSTVLNHTGKPSSSTTDRDSFADLCQDSATKSWMQDTLVNMIESDEEIPKDGADEDIFTNVAPAIEAAVMDSGREKATFERSYDMGDNLHKYLSVSVENVVGD